MGDITAQHRFDAASCKTPGIRPGIVNIKQGFWLKEFEEGSHNHLTHNTINEVQDMNGLANIPYNDVLVEVKSCKDITVK